MRVAFLTLLLLLNISAIAKHTFDEGNQRKRNKTAIRAQRKRKHHRTSYKKFDFMNTQPINWKMFKPDNSRW